MKTIACFTALGLFLVGCSPGVISESIVGSTIGETSWHLETDDNDGLIDTNNLGFGAYPNPRQVRWMDVNVLDDGTICANDGSKVWCGGPLQGIPYRAMLKVQENGYCVRVLDIYGNEVRSGCTEEPLPDDVTDKYVDTLDTSAQDSSAPGSAQDDIMAGATLVVEAINTMLEKIGLATRVSMPAEQSLSDFDRGDIPLGEGTCADVLEFLDDEYSDDHPGTDDYVLGPEAIAECLSDGRCRVGQLVTRAMAEACSALPENIDINKAEYGIIGAGGDAVGQLCEEEDGEIESCVGSPLVLDLNGDGLQLQGLAGGVSFPLLSEEPMRVGWLAGSDDALLALDVNGDGMITSGRELFGEASGGWAPDGFAALARYDENRDGLISAKDSVYEKLLAWSDDGDGRSASHELHSLDTLGVRSISLTSHRIEQEDAFGNQLGLLGSASSDQNRRVPVIDVWFRMETR